MAVDPQGNVKGGDPGKFAKTTAYDAAGNVTSVTDPPARITNASRDTANQRRSLTDPHREFQRFRRWNDEGRADGTVIEVRVVERYGL